MTGQQFSWTFAYPPARPGAGRPTSTVLYLPQNESVYFNMVSRDVIHAFWIPAFRLQEDVVPGITTHYRATPTRVGTYRVVCNLLCGVGHSLMRAIVVVLPRAQFDNWLAAEAGGGERDAGGRGQHRRPERGRRIGRAEQRHELRGRRRRMSATAPRPLGSSCAPSRPLGSTLLRTGEGPRRGASAAGPITTLEEC